ncbi:hypothetical protein [Sporosarcina sp. D27]|uniref:hypothetical protein n=1 Tax=Sporosarcina sp. D27 TaxID=1382305 RepID=UPI00046F3A80|nr:hypothetical protein [Sporosarcina sp. D27]
MGKIRSFKDVIQEEYYDEIFKGLADIIEENPSQLESRLNLVLKPYEASLEDFEKPNRVGVDRTAEGWED